MGIGAQEYRMKRRHQSVVTALAVLALGPALIAGCSTHRANKSFSSGVEKYDKEIIKVQLTIATSQLQLTRRIPTLMSIAAAPRMH